jgi:hypothetical protein
MSLTVVARCSAQRSLKFTCGKGARHRTVEDCSNAVRTLQRIEGIDADKEQT